MSKATEQELADLHAYLAKAYKRELQKDDISPTLLTSVANFLKHNGISCVPDEDEYMQSLKSAAENAMSFPFNPDEQSH